MSAIEMSDSKKALIIEDNVEIAVWLEELLETRGFEVVFSKDGLDGLERAKQEQPDLVVLDFFLPALDGCYVSAFIRRNKKTQHTKILAVSTRTTSEMHQLLEDAGIDLFIHLDSEFKSESSSKEVLEKLSLLIPQEAKAH